MSKIHEISLEIIEEESMSEPVTPPTRPETPAPEDQFDVPEPATPEPPAPVATPEPGHEQRRSSLAEQYQNHLRSRGFTR